MQLKKYMKKNKNTDINKKHNFNTLELSSKPDLAELLVVLEADSFDDSQYISGLFGLLVFVRTSFFDSKT